MAVANMSSSHLDSSRSRPEPFRCPAANALLSSLIKPHIHVTLNCSTKRRHSVHVENRHLQEIGAPIEDANNDEYDDDNIGDDDEASKQCNDTATPRGLLLLQKKDNKNYTPKSLSDSQSDKRNPFKMASNKMLMANTPVQMKGTSIFDSMEKQKPGRLLPSAAKPLINDSAETLHRTEKKSKSQVKISNIARKQNASKPEHDQKEKNEISTFEIWFEANKEQLMLEYVDCNDESELTVKAMHKYRQLIKVLRNTNENISTEEECRKRKRDNTDDIKASDCTTDESLLKDSTGNGLKKADRKLSSFTYSKIG